MKYLVLLTLLLSPLSAAALEFSNLKDKQAIRANNGDVTLEIKADEPFELHVDGVKVNNFKGEDTTITLMNMDRGAHTLILKSDQTATGILVHVLRVHR